MRIPTPLLVPLLALACVACGGSPTLPTPAPESTYVGAEPALDADAVARFGRDTKGLVLIDDLRPHVQALMSSSFARMFDVVPPAADDPNLAWVPEQIALGWTAPAEQSVDSLVRVYLLAALAIASSEEASGADVAERGRILQALKGAVQRMQVDGLTIAARFRTADQAGQVMFGLMSLASAGALQTMGALEARPAEDAIEMTFGAPSMWPPDALSVGLQEVGIGRADDPDLPALTAAVGAWRVQGRVERDDRWVVLRLGAPSTAPPLTVADIELPTRPTANAGRPIVAISADLSAWKGIADGWTALWREWRSTTSGRHLVRIDAADQGQLLDLEVITRRAQELGRTSTVRMDVIGSDLHVRTVERDLPQQTAPLTADGIVRWLPEDATAVGANRQQDFGRWMADVLWSVEDQLARRTLREDITGEGGEFEEATQTYYRYFSDLRTLIFQERAHPFEAPYAWAWMTPESGVPQLAVVSGVDEDKAPFAALDRLLRMALGPVMREDVPDADPRLEKADLGLGVETHAVRIEKPGAASDDIELPPALADIEPHVFMTDDVIVMSTSVELSRRILAREDADGAKSPLVDGRASLAWRIGTDALTVPMAALIDATEMPDGERMMTALRWFDGVEHASRFEGHNRVGAAVIRFRDPMVTTAAR